MTQSASAALLRDLVLARYQPPRRLRTRTQGTPFWVESRNGSLVVTPNSGIGRLIRMREIEAAWPHIAADEPRNTWKHISNNGSYLESIYDDADAAQRTVTPASGRAMSPPAPVAPHLEKRAQAYVDLRAQYRMETEQLGEQLDERRTEIIELRMELEAAREKLAARRTRSLGEVEELRADLGAARRKVRELQEELAAAADEAERKIAELNRQGHALELSRKELEDQLTEAIAARDEAESAHGGLAQRLRLAELKLRAVAEQAEQRGAIGKDEVARALTQTTLSLGVTECISEPRQREAMITAAGQLAGSPDAAVMECRRVLERCSRTMWEESFPGESVPARFSERMHQIYDTGVIPLPDWHRMKHLYARASDIVHNGGGSRRAALQIWLDTADIAELAASARPCVPPSDRGARVAIPTREVERTAR